MKKEKDREEEIQKAYREFLASRVFSMEISEYDCFRSGYIAGVLSTIKLRTERVKMK